MFYAFAVDIYGTVQAHYRLAAKSTDAALVEGPRTAPRASSHRGLVGRRVARLVRDTREATD